LIEAFACVLHINVSFLVEITLNALLHSNMQLCPSVYPQVCFWDRPEADNATGLGQSNELPKYFVVSCYDWLA